MRSTSAVSQVRERDEVARRGTRAGSRRHARTATAAARRAAARTKQNAHAFSHVRTPSNTTPSNPTPQASPARRAQDASRGSPVAQQRQTDRACRRSPTSSRGCRAAAPVDAHDDVAAAQPGPARPGSPPRRAATTAPAAPVRVSAGYVIRTSLRWPRRRRPSARREWRRRRSRPTLRAPSNHAASSSSAVSTWWTRGFTARQISASRVVLPELWPPTTTMTSTPRASSSALRWRLLVAEQIVLCTFSSLTRGRSALDDLVQPLERLCGLHDDADSPRRQLRRDVRDLLDDDRLASACAPRCPPPRDGRPRRR